MKRWEEVCFTYIGENWSMCQSQRHNPRYYQSSQGCMQTDHHSHWYCKKCKFNFNPNGYWKRPTEQDECDCQEDVSHQPTQRENLNMS
jgi:hypothetical protein